jgi:ribosomal protein L19E
MINPDEFMNDTSLQTISKTFTREIIDKLYAKAWMKAKQNGEISRGKNNADNIYTCSSKKDIQNIYPVKILLVMIFD